MASVVLSVGIQNAAGAGSAEAKLERGCSGGGACELGGRGLAQSGPHKWAGGDGAELAIPEDEARGFGVAEDKLILQAAVNLPAKSGKVRIVGGGERPVCCNRKGPGPERQRGQLVRVLLCPETPAKAYDQLLRTDMRRMGLPGCAQGC